MWRTDQIAISATPVCIVSITPKVVEGIFRNIGNNTVYIRETPSDVTTKGFPIPANTSFSFENLTGKVWAACASGLTSTIALVLVEE